MEQRYFNHLRQLRPVIGSYGYTLAVLAFSLDAAEGQGADPERVRVIRDRLVTAAQQAADTPNHHAFAKLAENVEGLPPTNDRFTKALGNTSSYVTKLGTEEGEIPDPRELSRAILKRWRHQTDKAALDKF